MDRAGDSGTGSGFEVGGARRLGCNLGNRPCKSGILAAAGGRFGDSVVAVEFEGILVVGYM